MRQRATVREASARLPARRLPAELAIRFSSVTAKALAPRNPALRLRRVPRPPSDSCRRTFPFCSTVTRPALPARGTLTHEGAIERERGEAGGRVERFLASVYQTEHAPITLFNRLVISSLHGFAGQLRQPVVLRLMNLIRLKWPGTQAWQVMHQLKPTITSSITAKTFVKVGIIFIETVGCFCLGCPRNDSDFTQTKTHIQILPSRLWKFGVKAAEKSERKGCHERVRRDDCLRDMNAVKVTLDGRVEDALVRHVVIDCAFA